MNELALLEAILAELKLVNQGLGIVHQGLALMLLKEDLHDSTDQPATTKPSKRQTKTGS